MCSKVSIAALFGAFLAAAAQSSTPRSASAQPTGPVVTLLLPGADEQVLLGSIVEVQSALTTLVVNCPAGIDSDECGVPSDGITVTRGPTTAIMSTVMVEESEQMVVTYGWECSLGGTTTAECVYSNSASITGSAPASLIEEIGGSETGYNSTMNLNATQLEEYFIPVTVTAGANMLEQSGEAETGSQTAGGSGSPTGTGADAPSDTGAAPSVKIGGLAIGGAIAAVLML